MIVEDHLPQRAAREETRPDLQIKQQKSEYQREQCSRNGQLETRHKQYVPKMNDSASVMMSFRVPTQN